MLFLVFPQANSAFLTDNSHLFLTVLTAHRFIFTKFVADAFVAQEN